ncbi:MAG: biotin/lipoate A/B protein ligase family protein [Thermoprotei archaeon]|nr:biotin/lipoate A/B protein ligase family protein [Thermoprotei archaeon]
MSPLRVIVDGPRDPQLNMAIDEAIARARTRVDYDTLRLYMWLPSGVSLGRGQDALKSVNIEAIGRLGFKLVRRPTGGAALLHPQEGEVTYSVVLSSGHELYALDVSSSAARIAWGVALAARRLGLEAGVRGLGEPGSSNYCYVNPGSSDVLVGGRKVSGSAQRRSWGALLQHGTLLLSYDPVVFTSVINVGGPEIVRAGDVVSGLRDLIGDIPLSSIIEALIEGFMEALGYRDTFKSSLSAEELSLALELYKVKYSRDEWNIWGAVEEKWK